jgi:hypothetical protein
LRHTWRWNAGESYVHGSYVRANLRMLEDAENR